MKKTAVVILKMHVRKEEADLEIPLDITARDLVYALNEAYNLDMDLQDIRNCYLKTERPIALLHGNKTLEEYNIRNGSVIHITD